MSEPNEIKDSNKFKEDQEIKHYSSLLRELAIEYEDRLYSIKIQIKRQSKLLIEKESELKEKERTKVHNIDLFSPIYNGTTQDDKLIYSMIEKIKGKLVSLKEEEANINEKVDKLKDAALFIDDCNRKLCRKDCGISIEAKEDKEIYNENGLDILEAQEIERQRIARELHDTTVQNLTSLVHKSELCSKLIDIDSIRAKLELSSMSHTVKSIINDMRGIIYNLKPMALDDLGLTVTIERYANRIMDLHNINVVVHSNNETKNILSVIKLTLFRIIQEACNNVIKHANASIININITYDENIICVMIRDNGNGFNINKSTRNESSGHSSSFGLSIMKERISLLSGSVDIKSEKDKGTTVIVSVPLKNYEGDKNE